MKFIRFNENNIYELNYQSLYILLRPDEPLNRLYAIVLGVRYVYFYEIVLIADFFFRFVIEGVMSFKGDLRSLFLRGVWR